MASLDTRKIFENRKFRIEGLEKRKDISEEFAKTLRDISAMEFHVANARILAQGGYANKAVIEYSRAAGIYESLQDRIKSLRAPSNYRLLLSQICDSTLLNPFDGVVNRENIVAAESSRINPEAYK
ncbi:MAG TPA: hypothetical protein VJK03_01770 [Candidatus Nanoarchaeia archaeon]|nr:hypothetical protein [Candidatus Nanoarchaeia archaeon]